MVLAVATLAVLHALPVQAEGSASFTYAGGDLIGGRHGSFAVLAPQVSVAHESGAFLDVTMPLARVLVDDREYLGLSDLGAVAGWQHRGYRVGLATMWPTGNAPQGLGTGHVMLAPRVDARLVVERLRLAATVMLRGAIPIGMHGQHHHQSIIAPHDLLDVAGVARLGLAPVEWLEVWGIATPVVPIVPHPTMSPGSRVAVGAEVSIRVWLAHITLQAQVPVTQNRTSSWQVSTVVAFGDSRAEQGCH